MLNDHIELSNCDIVFRYECGTICDTTVSVRTLVEHHTGGGPDTRPATRQDIPTGEGLCHLGDVCDVKGVCW